jgi:predicted Zn-dependent protease with MMP-like domain
MVPIGEERFMELVEDGVAALPPWVRETLDNVEIFVEDEPPNGQPLLGLYQGVPLASRGNHYWGALPDRITLFAGPIWRQAGGDEPRMKAIVAHTVAHEIAHHFGISDDRLREIDAY